jgi:hypothetical protein
VRKNRSVSEDMHFHSFGFPPILWMLFRHDRHCRLMDAVWYEIAWQAGPDTPFYPALPSFLVQIASGDQATSGRCGIPERKRPNRPEPALKQDIIATTTGGS